jgi:hypothetical protein
MGTRRFKQGMEDYEYHVNQMAGRMVRFLGKWRKATAHVRRLTLQRRADLAEFVRVLAEERQGYGTLRNCLAEERELFHKRLADSNNEWLRRVENCQAFYEAEIARLKEQVEAEKMFYAYHKADAERSREESKRLSCKAQELHGELAKLYRESAFLIILSIGLGVSLVVALILLVMSAQ